MLYHFIKYILLLKKKTFIDSVITLMHTNSDIDDVVTLVVNDYVTVDVDDRHRRSISLLLRRALPNSLVGPTTPHPHWVNVS